MRIHCTECSKKISIDDAFAGGVCRCPYCRALVFVPVESGGAEEVGGRPESPTERPKSPEELQAMAESKGQEHIPVADPVKVQGIVTMVLIGVLLAMGIAAGIVYLIRRGGVGDGDGPKDMKAFTDGPVVDPFRKGADIEGAWVAGNVPISSPILYVIDGGDTMKILFDFSVGITRISIRGLSDKDSFTILISRDIGEEDLFMDEGYRTGANERAAKLFLGKHTCRGKTELPRAMKAALERKPKTIVLFSAKPVSDLMELAGEAKKQGVKIITIAMGDHPGTKESMAELARAAGGHTRRYVESDQIDYPPPDLD